MSRTLAVKATRREQTGGSKLALLLFMVFTILQLTGAVSWSWWAVTAPLWGPIAILSAFICLVGFCCIGDWMFGGDR